MHLMTRNGKQSLHITETVRCIPYVVVKIVFLNDMLVREGEEIVIYCYGDIDYGPCSGGIKTYIQFLSP